MKERKTRIAEFIESIEDSQLSSTVFLGGESKKKKEEREYTENGSCTNADPKGCEYSVNSGNCKNGLGTCNHSTNGANCDNTYRPAGTGENTCSCCGKK